MGLPSRPTTAVDPQHISAEVVGLIEEPSEHDVPIEEGDTEILVFVTRELTPEEIKGWDKLEKGPEWPHLGF